MTSSSAAIDSAIRLIRTYTALHPRSADTLEGVAQWWLDGQIPLDVTAAALAQLCAAGEMEHVEVGTRQLWRRHRSGD